MVVENPAKHQCALFKSSRKHYEKAIQTLLTYVSSIDY